MNITAFTKIPTPVEGHEEIPYALSEPVKVVSIDGSGARIAEGDLPEGRVVVYDVVEYDEVERSVYLSDGHTELEPGLWVETFAREVHIDQIPRTETYAVAVAVE